MSNIMRIFDELKKRGQGFAQPEGEAGYGLLPAKKGDDAMTIEENLAEETQSAKDRKAEKKKAEEDGEKENEVTMAIDVFGRVSFEVQHLCLWIDTDDSPPFLAVPRRTLPESRSLSRLLRSREGFHYTPRPSRPTLFSRSHAKKRRIRIDCRSLQNRYRSQGIRCDLCYPQENFRMVGRDQVVLGSGRRFQGINFERYGQSL